MARVTFLVIRRRIFVVHLLLFLLIMGGLAALNLTLTPRVIWFAYPLIGWGIGLVLHFLSAMIWARDGLEEAVEDWKKRIWMRAFIIHLVVYLAVNTLLLVINLNFTPQILWILYPVAGWGVGLIMHLVLTLLWGPRSG